MRKLNNEYESTGVECLEEDWFLPLTNSTQGRHGTGGGNAARAAARLTFNWAMWAGGAEDCKAADVWFGRFASGAAAGGREAGAVMAERTAGGAVV